MLNNFLEIKRKIIYLRSIQGSENQNNKINSKNSKDLINKIKLEETRSREEINIKI